MRIDPNPLLQVQRARLEAEQRRILERALVESSALERIAKWGRDHLAKGSRQDTGRTRRCRRVWRPRNKHVPASERFLQPVESLSLGSRGSVALD